MEFFLSRPFFLLMIFSLVFATIIRLTQKFVILRVVLLCLFIYYFGPVLSIKLFLLASFIYFFSHKYKIFWVFCFFVFVQLYIILSLLFSPITSLYTLTAIGTIYIFIYQKEYFLSITNLFSKKFFLFNLNIVELLVLLLCFFLGSIPQSKYDAVHANLYNAKTYINTNSLSTLPESVSSIFPQNSIIYYSLFYQLGREKGLQIAYLLPLIIIFYCLNILKVKPLFITPFLLTPIIIFEASSGYYDLLIASLIIAAATILYTKTDRLKEIYMAAFIIGFAGGAKYFPMFLSILPILLFLKLSFKKIFIIPLFVVIAFPLSFWIVRSYIATNNPVFPFLQNVFPTPNIWDKNDILENNPMIKTTINLKQWATGAFAYYPVATYINTTNFMESLPHYTTIIYIFLIPLHIYIVITILYKIYKHESLNKLEITLMSLFLTYYFTGFITRYYRYIWPYQFTSAIFSMLYLQKLFKNNYKIIHFIILLFICIAVLNIRQVFNHLQIDYNFSSHVLKPDFYQTSKIISDPITFLNQITNNNPQTKTLDASKYMLGRFNFSSRVFQCNWYWYDKVIDIIKHKNDLQYYTNLTSQFDYIITHNPPSEGNNLCVELLLPQLPNYNKVYEDQYYQIFQVKNEKNI